MPFPPLTASRTLKSPYRRTLNPNFLPEPLPFPIQLFIMSSSAKVVSYDRPLHLKALSELTKADGTALGHMLVSVVDRYQEG